MLNTRPAASSAPTSSPSPPASPAPPTSKSSAASKQGDEIVTGRYKVLRALKSGTAVKRDNTPEADTDNRPDVLATLRNRSLTLQEPSHIA